MMNQTMISRAIETNAMPSIGSILGSTGSTEIINSINDQMNNSHFFNNSEDAFIGSREVFLKEFIDPIKENIFRLKKITDKIRDPHEDKIRPLIMEEDFDDVPPCMQLAILTYEPIKKLLNKGRIFGFGYDAENIDVQEDVYGRLINNGLVENIRSDNNTIDKGGCIEHIEEYKSTDPIWTFDELDMVDDTRQYIDQLLKMKKDPTDFLNPIG